MDAAAVTAPVSKSVGDVELNVTTESDLSFSKSRKQTLNPDRYQIFLHIKLVSKDCLAHQMAKKAYQLLK